MQGATTDGGAAPIAGLEFHHVGLACRDLAAETAAHALLGFRPEGEVFEDPHQRVRGSFQVLGSFRVELLAPLDEESPVQDWLRRGIRMYHVCYETDDLAGALDALGRGGHRAVSRPAPAVAFGGRPVAFVMLRTRSLVELLQR
ncbi:Glyoxalase/Bleomycin resistance protein/Dioxygenase superfamily protein [Klenkia soli]|uniref:Glyoxalase/Bleomycin resistance protein/Dioxygenase superfamily protein n=1 Tax=Klenkia soli TaxID=1052260 RepID=A0A1H0CIS4_9ACTN|nr:VOC family protein [Klenkia soli]SDN57766.1 Glyoxalase/Bleomycin resistance protein/Dioxygenase superfamily protein [Klenkia soli]